MILDKRKIAEILSRIAREHDLPRYSSHHHDVLGDCPERKQAEIGRGAVH